MKKKSLLILLVGVLALLVVTGIGTTYAWLTDEDSTEATYTVGEVSYEINKGTPTTGLVVPGQGLIDDFTITNASNVKTQFRVKFEIVSVTTTSDTEWSIGTNLSTDELYLCLTNNWTFVDDCAYYGGVNGVIESTTTTLNDIFDNETDANSTIKINGGLVGNADATAVIKIKVTFQAKQADYVTWQDLTDQTINFSTGLAN